MESFLPWALVAGPTADAVVSWTRSHRPLERVLVAHEITAIRPSASPTGPIVGSTLAFVSALLGLVVLSPTTGAATGGLGWDRLGGLVAAFALAMSIVIRRTAGRSLAGDRTAGQFDAAAALLAAISVVVATAAHPLAFVGGWALTTPVVVLLVRHDRRAATRQAARTAGRCLLVGDAALAAAGVLAVYGLHVDVLRPGATIEAGPLTTAVALLVVLAALVRAALPPFHRWLTGSIAAPTAVSALLHAGVVNGGGLLLVRWSMVTYASTPAVVVAVAGGLAASVLGVAVLETRADVKSGLVWSTVAQMGFMTLQAATGLAGPAIAHLLGHGMYKAHLFLASGSALEARAAPHERARRGWFAVSAGLAVVATAAAFWLIRPPFVDLGWVWVLPFAFLAASLTVTLTEWIPGPWRRVAGAWVGCVALAFGAVAITAIIDHVLAPSLPAAAPAVGGVAAITSVVVALAAAVGLSRLRVHDGPTADRAYAQALTVGVPIPNPIGAS